MRSIFISLSPNTLPADIRRAAAVLFQPHRWRSYGKLIPEIQKRLEDAVGNRNVVLTSSGRMALYEGLQALEIHEGDEVLLQAFTCLAVPEAIVWAGAKPVYIDIDPATYNIDPQKIAAAVTPKTRAIIIQHTFGIPAPLDEIIAIARQHKLLIIEDIAHALGGTYKGQPLGSFGDVTIASFGRDKTISSVFGGALFSPTEQVAKKYRQRISQYPLPSSVWVIQQLLHPLLVNMFLPFYFVANLGKALLVTSQRLGLLSMAVTHKEKTAGAKPYFIGRQFHPALAPLLKHQIEQLTVFTARRRAIAQRYLGALKSNNSMQSVAADANWLRFPVRASDQSGILAATKKAHILLGDWYSTPVTPAALNQTSLTHYIPGSCPEAEKASRETINLPTHPRMSDADIERVIEFMKNYDPGNN